MMRSIAYHYSKAGNAPKAIAYLIRLAERVARVYERLYVCDILATVFLIPELKGKRLD